MTTSPHDTGSQAAVRTTSELNPSGKTFFGHPRMLANLFSVEMWERFSYYGMQGAILFIMYLLGGIAAMTVAALFKSTLLRKGTLPFYLEMPPLPLAITASSCPCSMASGLDVHPQSRNYHLGSHHGAVGTHELSSTY